MIKWITFLVAAAGLALAVYTAATAKTEPPRAPLAAEPSINPFQAGIAASGAVEPATRSIGVSPAEGGLVTRVLAEVGEVVERGAPLMELDARPLHAELLTARAARDSAAARLERRRALPRAEEVPALEAAVAAMRAEIADWEDQERRLREAGQAAASERDLSRVLFSLQGARARLAQVEADLGLMRAGAWEPDLAVDRAEVAEAEARIRALEALIERRTVRSPIRGTVLKRNVEPGQFAAADSRAPALVVGDLSTLHVRARVDEEDLPMLRAGARGAARIRGRAEIVVPLSMVRIEPLAEPKTQLSGSTTERVDTRVLEVVFRAEPEAGSPAPPMYPGQNVDVFIDASGAVR